METLNIQEMMDMIQYAKEDYFHEEHYKLMENGEHHKQQLFFDLDISVCNR